ncbi:MAG: hypothetical protein EPN73_00035 [Paraburkholderia sp.]|uniref:pilus assembly protein TadG-related protein n=1 Tax=Paraburkholderia sp. TaxID=1926495 RepID=UPI0012062AB7|nr:pilus assembly protein TadG-related protein [Paraburkholderia sp.]TAL98982.1 MAG: hypothetical protein EPN73_00035 [Paraburkholderia sp.]
MNRSARPGRARVAGASGQALVSALIFLLVGGIGLFVAFNSFQMTSARIKLQNTADAAAYSAAVLQARDYNFAAYTNRAMVANQVTAAQAGALKSWIDDLEATYGPSGVDQTIEAYADHSVLWQTPKQAGHAEIAPVRATLDALLPAVASGIGRITRALSDAQLNYHAATLVSAPQTADAVAQQNQPDTHVTAGYFTSARNATQLAAWTNYTQIVTPAGASGADHFADVVTDATTLDAFLKDRSATRSTGPRYQELDDSGATRCRFSPSNAIVSVRAYHNGGTQLRQDKKGWEAIDATMASVYVSCFDMTFPVIAGTGGSVNGDVRVQGVESYLKSPPFVAWSDWQGYGGYYNFGDHTTGTPGLGVSDGLAQKIGDGPGTSLDLSNGGLLPYQDINGAPVTSAAPRITIEVERASETRVKTQGLQGGGRMAVTPADAGGVMRALASANAYFVRPNPGALNATISGALLHAKDWLRADGKTEFPDTFSPYWQATLAPTSDTERNAARAAQIPASESVQP